MRRGTIAFDRFAGAVLSLVLLAVGLAVLAWWGTQVGRMPGNLDVLPDELSTTPVTDMMATAWWPWACAVGGVILILVGLRWLAVHLPDRAVSHLKLPGSTTNGRLLVEARPVANAAAHVLESTPGVRSARGTIRRERGQVVVRLTATIEREADLALVAAAADQVSADLAKVLERDDLSCCVQLTVASGHRSLSRVH